MQSSNYIKVGFSEDKRTIKDRIRAYNTHNPDYELLAIFQGSKIDEKNLHKLLEPHKHKLEWFINSQEVLDIIDDYVDANYLNNESVYFWKNLFNCDVEELENNTEEIYSKYQRITIDQITELIITIEEKIIIYNHIGQKFYQLFVDDFQVYYKGYNIDNDPRNVSAVKINDVVVAEIKERDCDTILHIYNKLDELPKCIKLNEFEKLDL